MALQKVAADTSTDHAQASANIVSPSWLYSDCSLGEHHNLTSEQRSANKSFTRYGGFC
jgi:hypothetical protein